VNHVISDNAKENGLIKRVNINYLNAKGKNIVSLKLITQLVKNFLLAVLYVEISKKMQENFD